MRGKPARKAPRAPSSGKGGVPNVHVGDKVGGMIVMLCRDKRREHRGTEQGDRLAAAFRTRCNFGHDQEEARAVCAAGEGRRGSPLSRHRQGGQLGVVKTASRA